ncbi:MAG: tRNA epoxyqueuosine(34) reductase QueG, partial [Phycisphaerales bacterium]
MSEHRETPEQLGRRLVERAGALGFACAGIAGIEPSEHAGALRAWLDAGMHGTMGWMADHAELRADPGKLIEGGRSVLMVGDLYAGRDGGADEPVEIGRGKIARYARGKDYHKLMKKRLVRLLLELKEAFPEADFKAFVDTAPVPERELAQRAGIGWVGKHTLIIHPKLGSYLFLGGIVTTLEATAPPEQETVSDHCGSCTRCIDACPTDAITPHRVDARRCISYLTIEHREPIERELASKMGDWIYGCDICQEVCPHNSPKPAELLPATVNEAYRSERASFDLLEVLGWSEEDRREAFTGSAMKRAKLGMMRRNTAIVAGNQVAGGMSDAVGKAMLRKLREI